MFQEVILVKTRLPSDLYTVLISREIHNEYLQIRFNTLNNIKDLPNISMFRHDKIILHFCYICFTKCFTLFIQYFYIYITMYITYSLNRFFSTIFHPFTKKHTEIVYFVINIFLTFFSLSSLFFRGYVLFYLFHFKL